jgi:hypothetical protein
MTVMCLPPDLDLLGLVGDLRLSLLTSINRTFVCDAALLPISFRSRAQSIRAGSPLQLVHIANPSHEKAFALRAL